MKAKIFTLLLFVSLIAPKLNAQPVLFQEDFTGVADWGAINNPSKWFNKIIEGSGRIWSGKTGIGSTAPVAFSYNRTAGADSWLLTAAQVDLSSTANSYQCEFSFGCGYYVANEPFRFHVLATESFDGVNPMNSTWTDITSLFLYTLPDGVTTATLDDNIKIPPSTGYPGTRIFKANLTAFAGKKIHLAFRNMLIPVKTDGTVYSTAAFYAIDNIKVTSAPLSKVKNVESKLMIWSSNEYIHINPKSETLISVYDVSGKMVVNNLLINDLYNVKVSKGLYVIKSSDEVKKIIVN